MKGGREIKFKKKKNPNTTNYKKRLSLFSLTANGLTGKSYATLFTSVFTINCSTLQFNRSLTASSQSLSSFSTCSIAFSASLYRFNTDDQTQPLFSKSYNTVKAHMKLLSRYFFHYNTRARVACSHLHAHKSTALAEVSFGPVWCQLNGAFSICQGLRVLLQAVITIRTIPKEPTKVKNNNVTCV